MKALFEKFLFDILHSTKISLAVLIAVLIFLTPAFTGVAGFVQTVYANSRQIKEHNRRFERVDMLDDKVSAMMIEMGIQKELRAIESRYKQQHNKGE